ncbi:MAG: zinc ribbon domain-containing protein [Acidobacteria bacterium]|nr:zinc ribbon domain-containing protein [Acidobacteriota bacterium]
MPIYEFYCPDCHAIYNFLSRRVETEKQPDCPRCGRPRLERQVSRFAISRGLAEPDDDGLPPGLDEEKLEQAFMSLAGEAENINEDDPRQAAQLMRKLYEATGLPLGSTMDEAIRRMEAGEDPDQIEADLGDMMDEEDPFSSEGLFGGGVRQSFRRKFLPPRRDETLYEL